MAEALLTLLLVLLGFALILAGPKGAKALLGWIFAPVAGCARMLVGAVVLGLLLLVVGNVAWNNLKQKTGLAPKPPVAQQPGGGSQPEAVDLQLPIRAKWQPALGFGGENSDFLDPTGKLKKHVAQDMEVGAGTPVYPLGPGTVKYARPNATYGHAPDDLKKATAAVVVVEHPTRDGVVCAVYGHLKTHGLPAEGSRITDTSAPLGEVASLDEIHPYSPEHLHFGIRKGAYEGAANRAGYLPQGEFPGLWEDPVAFVGRH
jgi:murein DD-endopeptidase MepM/ murein hydrolase activator NlpD